MGWFDNQIRQRIQYDDEMFSDSFIQMANLVTSKKIVSSFTDDRRLAEEAIGDILKYYHIKAQEIPEQIKDINEVLEFLLRPSGIMRRTIKLSDGWYRHAVGAMLGAKKDGNIIAILPGKLHGYYYKDYATGDVVRITKKSAKEIEMEAICFYQPLPLKKLGMTSVLKYIFMQLHTADYLFMIGSMLIATALGMVMPYITRYLYGEVLEYGSSALLMGAILTLLCVTISSSFISLISEAIHVGASTRLNLAVESATMMRVLSLPVDFFKKYSSGELANRVGAMNSLCTMLFQTIFSTGLSAVFSLVYLGQIVNFAPALVAPSIAITLLTFGMSVVAAIVQMHILEKQMVETGKENGMVYAFVNGITKIKNAGAEKRAFAQWSRQYVKGAKHIYQPPLFLRFSTVVTTAISLIGTVYLYYTALKSNVTLADYMAFNSAYGLVNGAFVSLAGITSTIARIRPIFQMVSPILQTKPEVDTKRQVVTTLRGGIELNNVSFRYDDSMPNVLDNLSLKIRSGQYVAIVGRTGCGKSTLMRVLLGFERPQKGAVYYDGKDISTMDLKSLRRKIGVVMQSGRLFQGDIYSNIAISAPQLTLEEAWEAAEMAGMAEDIRRMPMGMHTLITEGQGGISGGQRQRLMIARAIAPKPKILMFDEATSALDNVTQKIVSESLRNLKCTRIVIAHRLSTIKQCDRIIVLDNGRIVEDGAYEELLGKNGYFAKLVERQQIEMEVSR